MNIYKLSYPISLVLMVFLVLNCSGGGFHPSLDDDDDDAEIYREAALYDKTQAEHTRDTTEYLRIIYDYVKTALWTEKQTEKYGQPLSPFHWIAIDSNHQEGLPTQLKSALQNMGDGWIKSQLRVITGNSYSALTIALEAHNYKLIQEFITLGLPLIHGQYRSILAVLAEHLTPISKMEITKENQKHFLNLFKDCLQRMCKDSEILKFMETAESGFSGWNHIVMDIFLSLSSSTNHKYYKSMFNELVTILNNQSPDLIVNCSIIKNPKKIRDEDSDIIKEEKERLNEYIKYGKQQAEQANPTKLIKQPIKNPDNNGYWGFLSQFII